MNRQSCFKMSLVDHETLPQAGAGAYGDFLLHGFAINGDLIEKLNSIHLI
jgi:hypothetical protein